MTAEARPNASSLPIPVFLALAVAIAVALIVVDNWRFVVPAEAGPLGRDFVVFWTASQALWRGDLQTVFDPIRFSRLLQGAAADTRIFSPFPYPPSAVWFIAPLAALPYGAAFVAWMAGTFAAFAASLRTALPMDWRRLAVLATAPASLVNVVDGQNGFLSAALLCGGLLSLERRPVLAGVLIGLLTFKPQLGLLLPFVLIAGGYGRAFLAAAATGIVLFAGSWLVLGWEPWSLYLDRGAPMQQLFLEGGDGPFKFMVPSFFMAGRLLGLPLWLGYAVQGVTALAVLAACCWTMRRPIALERRAAVVMVGALLAPPYCFNYDMTALLSAQLLAWSAYPDLDDGERLIFALAWILPALMAVTGVAGIPIGPPVLVAVFAVLVGRAAGATRFSAGARSVAA